MYMGPYQPVVYVVDDEKVIAETLAVILNQAGFKALPFRTETGPGCSRVWICRFADFGLVMPGMSGIALAIQFRKIFRMQILLFSGQAATANLLEDARSDGYEFEVLAKPIIRLICSKLARVLSQWPGRAK